MAGAADEPSSLFTKNGQQQLSDSLPYQNITLAPTTRLLDVVHFNYAWFLGLIFLIALLANSFLSAKPAVTDLKESILLGPGGKPLPRRKSKEERDKKTQEDFGPGRKQVFLYLSAALLATFVAHGFNIVVHALVEQDGWWCGEATAIYVLASAFFYSIFLISLVDMSPAPSIAHQVTWVVATVAEAVLLAATIDLNTNKEINSVATEELKRDNRHGRNSDRIPPNEWELAEVLIGTIRLVILLFLVGFYITFSVERRYKNRSSSQCELDENAPLLRNGHVNGHYVPENGTIHDGNIPQSANGHAPASGLNECPHDENGHSEPSSKTAGEIPAFYKPTTVPNRTWWEYLKGYSVFFPYLWPSKSLRLQIVVVICFILVLLQRLVNVAVPLQIGKVTNQLSTEDGGDGKMPWVSISILIALKFLQGTSGILGALRSVLWIPISQYSYKALTTASFEHVHGLSLDFHLGKRTGEVLSALSKGNAINNFLEQITFSVLPMVVDLGLAIFYFGVVFDAYYALVVTIITFSYLYLTIRMARWRSEQRRQMTNLSREEDAVKNDSLTSYETVKYFNAEDYEFDRYRKAVSAFQKMEYKVTVSLNVLNISQNMVFMTGLLATSLLSAYQVTIGKRKVGDFVILLTYMAQLQQPLNFFGTFYRSVQSAMISGERLLELFKEQPTVVDDFGATKMPSCEGQITFKNVKFSYDQRKPALEDLSFTCRPGTTTAFVGESGGGKSTVFRLLFRFYNTQDGSIQVDGNDVKGITIDSLRQHIGVVPQDTVLFNETLMYNLKYANQNATDAEVHAACRAASIHDKIMAFPDKYETKVGERGLRLSGGEKQRVAIARTIIKNPRIIMLDEATAALDSTTEQNIQEALTTLSEGRTMLVIAHRLSTITSADQILVLHAGRVAEAGTHQELIERKGRYYNMWRKQIKAERAMEQASQMVAKAQALKEASIDRPGSSGNEGSPSEDVSENEADGSKTLVNASLASRSVVRAAEAFTGDSSREGSDFGDDGQKDAKSLIDKVPTHDTRSTNSQPVEERRDRPPPNT